MPATNDHPPSKKSKKAAGKPIKESPQTTKPSTVKEVKPVEATNGSKTQKENSKVSTKATKATPRKRAADFLSDEETTNKDASSRNKEDITRSPVQAKKKAKSGPAEPKISAASPANKGEQKKMDIKDAADESDSEEDDQTAALIKGFESSEDEKDPSDDEGYEPGQEVPKIPDSKQVKRRIKNTQKKQSEPEAPGVVYLG